VKNAKQGTGLLFTATKILANFHCNLCSNRRVRPCRAFGILVEGDLLSNFGIQSLEYFYFKNWRKIGSKLVKETLFETRRTRARRRLRTRHVGSPYPGRARMPRRRSNQRSEARAAPTVQLGPMTRVGSLGRCHAACAHSPARAPPSATGRRPAARSQPLWHPCLSSCRPRSCKATASARPGL
jgi:hypothetical protein